MSDYYCDKCEKTFKRKRNLDYHMKNAVCVDNEKKYDCKYCSASFTTKNSMYRHMREYCKIKKDDDMGKDAILQRLLQLETDNLKLQNKVNELSADKTINIGTVNGPVNNGTINNNIMVNVVPFGKEDLSKIDKGDLLQVFRSGFNSALRLTETTHFNPKYPEYHNVYISNMKNKYAMTYDGDDWALVMKDELIDKMYDNKRDYIEENIDEFYKSLLPSQINALHRWLNVDDDHQYVQKVKNDMKLMLYNKRKMALDPKPPKITDLEETNIRVIKRPKDHNGNNSSISIKRRHIIAPRNGRYRKAIARRR